MDGFVRLGWERTSGYRWSSLLRFWPLLIPVLFLLPGWLAFPYPSAEARYSDLVVTHYPNAYYFREAVLSWQTLPLWSPTILSGYPFAANPLSGMWYPPGWLALFLPLPFGFNLLVSLHLIWGGFGMYCYLRLEGLSHRSALFGGVAFSAMPKLFAHYGAGHLTLLYAVPWTPWLLYAGAKYYQKSPRLQLNQPRLVLNAFSPAIILALIFLADVRWAVYAGLLWAGYTMVGRQFTEPLRNRMYGLLFMIFVAALLSAPLAMPFLEYTWLSTRAHLSEIETLTYSLPPARLLGLIYPDFSGFHEWMLYPGAMVLLLALLSLVWVINRTGVKFWVGVCFLGILYSLGEYIFIWLYLVQLPGFDLLRVPPRVLFVVGIGLAVLAAHALEKIFKGLSDRERRRAGLLLVAFAGFVVVLAAGVWFLTTTIPGSFAWGAGAITFGAVWIGLKLRPHGQVAGGLKSRLDLWYLVLIGVILVDLGVVDLSLYAPRSAQIVFAEGEALADVLAAEPGTFRVYSPSYSLPQQSAVRSGIQLVDGVDPLQLEKYARFMEAASGVPLNGYSVTLPPFEGGEPATANERYRPDPELLGLLNARYVAAEFDLSVEGLVLQERIGNTRLYKNMLNRPRAWVAGSFPMGADNPDHLRLETGTPAELLVWEPNYIELLVSGPGVLVLSELNYPGWRVQVDGEEREILEISNLLRGVSLEPGQHKVIFRFWPVSLWMGLGLWLSGIGLIAYKWRKDRP